MSVDSHGVEGRPPPTQKRLFTAIALPEDIRAVLFSLKQDIPGLRWVPEHTAHLTLRFIGNVPAETLASIATALKSIRSGRFIIRIRGLGVFTQRQTVLWAGLAACPELAVLKERVDTALYCGAGLDLPRGNFFPHITLGRMKARATPALRDFVSARAASVEAAFEAESFTLFSSMLAPGGAVHTPEAVYPLG